MAAKPYETRECRTCEKKFAGPKTTNYRCGDKPNDANHDVEPKTYYVAAKGLTIHWKKEKKSTDGAGNVVMLESPRDITFMNGIVSTSDPEEQDFLDRYDGCISYEQWERVHMSAEARREKTHRENESMKSTMAEKDAELAKLRAQLEAKAK